MKRQKCILCAIRKLVAPPDSSDSFQMTVLGHCAVGSRPCASHCPPPPPVRVPLRTPAAIAASTLANSKAQDFKTFPESTRLPPLAFCGDCGGGQASVGRAKKSIDSRVPSNRDGKGLSSRMTTPRSGSPNRARPSGWSLPRPCGISMIQSGR